MFKLGKKEPEHQLQEAIEEVSDKSDAPEVPEEPQAEESGKTDGQLEVPAAVKTETRQQGKKYKRKSNKKQTSQENPEKHEKQERHNPTVLQKQPKIINSLVGNLSHALEEDVSEIDGMLDEQPREYHDRENKPAKYRFFLIFGLIVFWLAIIGTFDVVKTVREFSYNISNQTALKDEFALFLYPVVINDPPEFTGTESLQTSTVISSAIWKIILTGDTANYAHGMGIMTIPEIDVEAAARSIFGYGFDIEHRTIDNIIIAFDYAPESKSYLVPENPVYFTYSPGIANISNTGETYKVTVEYIAPSPLLISGIEYENEPAKTMIYTITRSKDIKTIQSIEFDREQERKQ